MNISLFIYNETIANIYLQEFEKRWSELGNSTSLVNQKEQIEVIILPNPTNLSLIPARLKQLQNCA